MAGPFNYYLGRKPYLAKDPIPMWGLPPGCRASLSLSGAAQNAAANPALPATAPLALYWLPGTLDASYTFLGNGDCRQIPATALMKSAWKSATGYQPNGATLADLAFDHLTAGSSVGGITGPGPLLAGPDSLEVVLQGHGQVRRDAFAWGAHPHTAQLQATYRDDFRTIFNETQKGLHAPAIPQKWLGWLVENHKLLGADDWKLLVPLDLQPHIAGPTPPSTAIADTFIRGDQSHLGTASGGFTYTELTGGDLGGASWNIVSNQAKVGSGVGNNAVRAESDLSTANHDVSIRWFSGGSGAQTTEGGVLIRFSSAAATGYAIICRTDTADMRLLTLTAGTIALVTSQAASISLPQAVRATITGTSPATIVGKLGGTTDINTTDSTFSTGLRTGLFAYANPVACIFDTFSASDLVAASSIFVENVFPASLQDGRVIPMAY